MNNLLFTALIIALLYYFFYYLPQKKKISNQPLPIYTNKETQTEPHSTDTLNCPGPQFISESETKLLAEKQTLLKDISQKEKTITNLNNSYQKLETKKKEAMENSVKQITKLKEQLTNQDKEITELKSTEKTLDNLLKNIQDFTNEL